MPKLLDLFCCDGGAAVGYARAGWEVVGVDIAPHPRYPFEFHQADALTYPLEGFDAIHASPPCQRYSVSRHTHSHVHPDLVAPTRARLLASGLPYVIENVIGAPLRAPIMLCGTMFDMTIEDGDGTPLFLARHRLFESNVWLTIPLGCRCLDFKDRGYRVGGVYNGGAKSIVRADRVGAGYTPKPTVAAKLMQIDWMTYAGLTQAIPPAYTEWVGTQLLTALEKVA